MYWYVSTTLKLTRTLSDIVIIRPSRGFESNFKITLLWVMFIHGLKHLPCTLTFTRKSKVSFQAHTKCECSSLHRPTDRQRTEIYRISNISHFWDLKTWSSLLFLNRFIGSIVFFYSVLPFKTTMFSDRFVQKHQKQIGYR